MQSGNTLEQLPLGEDAQKAALDRARKALGSIILGKDQQIALALSCLLARGHLLIEDLPGLGKTMLAQALARVQVHEERSGVGDAPPVVNTRPSTTNRSGFRSIVGKCLANSSRSSRCVVAARCSSRPQRARIQLPASMPPIAAKLRAMRLISFRCTGPACCCW